MENWGAESGWMMCGELGGREWLDELGGREWYDDVWRKGRDYPTALRNLKHICGCHNFFPLSSVQIIIIPACCLLCVL